MQPDMFFLPVLYTVFLWWFTTGLIMAVYKSPQRIIRLWFLGATVALVVACFGIFATRHGTTPRDVYLSVTCGIVIWGWQVAGYYLGFVTGPTPPQKLPRQGWKLSLRTRLRVALFSGIYHEVVALAFAVLLLALTWGTPNAWGAWIYVALWVMHSSAKVNVFFGVRNFRIDLLPSQFQHLDGLLNKQTSNAFFPFSVLLASSVALLLVYQGIIPDATPSQTVGFLLIGTMIALGVLEHWLLVLPLPAVISGWGLSPVTEEAVQYHVRTEKPMSTATTTPPKTRKHTYTFTGKHSPLVVDVWEPTYPSGETPVLLIHGWGGSGSYWRQTAADLSETVRVIVPDLPGTGRSQPVDAPQGMFDQVASIMDVLDLLALDRVQVVGHSMGGGMALLLADEQPERVERIVLTSLTFFMTQQQIRVYRTVMQVFKVTMHFRPSWLVDVPYMTHMMGRQYFYKMPKNQALLREGLMEYLRLDGGTAATCANDATTPRIPEAGGQVQVPVLLVACRHDNMMPIENIDYTADIIPDCDVRWIEDCGHMPMIEKHDEYMLLLREFLRL